MTRNIPPIPVFVPGEKFQTLADVEKAIEKELNEEVKK